MSRLHEPGRIVIVLLILGVCSWEAASQEEPPPMEMATHEITFEGQATGGTLTLGDTPRRISRFVSIQTTPGEFPESVAHRLFEARTQFPEFMKCCGFIGTEGGSLILSGFPEEGEYILGGTERGLGIPDPPTSLSAFYDPAADQILLNWDVPPSGYDLIRVVFDALPLRGDVQGNATFHIITDVAEDPHIFNENDLDVCVLGYKGTVPSNAGAIHVKECVQEELINLPFTDNVAPNWSAWRRPTGTESVAFQQAEKDLSKYPRRRSRFFREPSRKPFFQLVSTSAEDAAGGVWRQFLGLNPGHTYRLSVRLNTLGTSKEDGDWRCSFHVAPNGSEGGKLTVDQLAGLSPLPAGIVGPDAAKIVEYGPEKKTGGEWIETTTGSQSEEQVRSEDITLPEGVTSITVWLRLTGKKPSGVGMDWIRLEDLTCSR